MNFSSIEQENIAARKALETLKNQPGWARVEACVENARSQWLPQCRRLADSRSRRGGALKHLCTTADIYLELVSDTETSDAFCNLLPLLIRHAYLQYGGILPQTFKTNSEETRSFEREIELCSQEWTRKANQRVQSKTSEKGVTMPNLDLLSQRASVGALRSSTYEGEPALAGNAIPPGGDHTDAPTVEHFPGGVSRVTWARIKAIDAVLKTRRNQGSDRDRVVCESLQQCFDILAKATIEEGEDVTDRILRQELQDSLLEIAVALQWLEPSMAPNQIVWGHREWLMNLLEGRIAYFESCLLGEPFGDIDKLGYIVVKVPETNPLFQSEEALEELKKKVSQPPKVFHIETLKLHASSAYGTPPEKVTPEQLETTIDEFMRKYGSINVTGIPETQPGHGDGGPQSDDSKSAQSELPVSKGNVERAANQEFGTELTDSEAGGAEDANRAPGVAEFEEKRQAERDKIRLALESTDRDEKPPPAFITAEFWEKRQTDFEKYAAIYADLAAHWQVSQGWTLCWGETLEAIEGPKEGQRAFNALARKALEGVPKLTTLDAEPWQAWLEFMHYRHWPFEVTTIIPGSVQRMWDSAVKDGRTVYNCRDEVKYATDEFDKWRYGLLLKGVFPSSALFCLELSAHVGEDASNFASGRANPEGRNPGVSARHETPGPTAPSTAAAELGSVRQWSDLTITFLSDERVRIAFPGASAENRNYEEMGFGDGRGGKPRAAWQALREFSGNPTKPMRIDKKRAQEIRALLQKQFLINSDPLLFKKRLGYLTRFKICRSSSFDT